MDSERQPRDGEADTLRASAGDKNTVHYIRNRARAKIETGNLEGAKQDLELLESVSDQKASTEWARLHALEGNRLMAIKILKAELAKVPQSKEDERHQQLAKRLMVVIDQMAPHRPRQWAPPMMVPNTTVLDEFWL